MRDYLLILCNCPDEATATAISTQLLQQRLVACANRLPAVQSSYIWQGKLEQAVEIQLQLKAPKRNFTAIEQAISAIHPYAVPEIIAVELCQLNQAYAAWINEVTCD
jgi:periplasmic divalent cation tolerance protein